MDSIAEFVLDVADEEGRVGEAVGHDGGSDSTEGLKQ